MKLAWGASIVAQALLLAALWRAGRRDWWTAYLAFGIVRTAMLWPLAGWNYWWAWIITEPLAAGLQFLAAGESVRSTPRQVLHIGGIAAASAFTWSLMLTDPDWPIMRRAGLAVHQAGSFGCFGLLVAPMAYGGTTSHMLLMFYVLRVARALAEQLTIYRTVDISTVYLGAVALLFCGWSFLVIRGGESARYAR